MVAQHESDPVLLTPWRPSAWEEEEEGHIPPPPTLWKKTQRWHHTSSNRSVKWGKWTRRTTHSTISWNPPSSKWSVWRKTSRPSWSHHTLRLVNPPDQPRHHLPIATAPSKAMLVLASSPTSRYQSSPSLALLKFGPPCPIYYSTFTLTRMLVALSFNPIDQTPIARRSRSFTSSPFQVRRHGARKVQTLV